jgi:hypothetical protein
MYRPMYPRAVFCLGQSAVAYQIPMRELAMYVVCVITSEVGRPMLIDAKCKRCGRTAPRRFISD